MTLLFLSPIAGFGCLFLAAVISLRPTFLSHFILFLLFLVVTFFLQDAFSSRFNPSPGTGALPPRTPSPFSPHLLPLRFHPRGLGGARAGAGHRQSRLPTPSGSIWGASANSAGGTGCWRQAGGAGNPLARRSTTCWLTSSAPPGPGGSGEERGRLEAPTGFPAPFASCRWLWLSAVVPSCEDELCSMPRPSAGQQRWWRGARGCASPPGLTFPCQPAVAGGAPPAPSARRHRGLLPSPPNAVLLSDGLRWLGGMDFNEQPWLIKIKKALGLI